MLTNAMGSPYISQEKRYHGITFRPVVFLRGFAMRQTDIEAAVEDPFSGFSEGSTKHRQGPEGRLYMQHFESPVIRLMTDYGYEDVYREGREPETVNELKAHTHPEKTLWVYRYYESASQWSGSGRRSSIEELANGLDALIERLRGLFGGLGEDYRRDFKVHLVAHSMGGLVVRSYLQKVFPKAYKARTGETFKPEMSPVDKVFTYGTPHNGIELRGLGNTINVGLFDISNFYRPNMANFLGLTKADVSKGLVNDLKGKFPPSRFFCLIGTNHQDYNIKLSTAAVGPMSDGLVRIQNGWVRGAPRAHVHRAHGGPVGMVNSEDGYQNLQRFLFGDTQIHASLTLSSLTLPEEISEKHSDGKAVDANFYFDVVGRVRGSCGWGLTQRQREQGSAVRRSFSDLFRANGGAFKAQRIRLLSAYLDSRFITKERGKYMAMQLQLGVHADQFVVDRAIWLDAHYDGVEFLRESLYLEVRPADDSSPWRARAQWGHPPAPHDKIEVHDSEGGGIVLKIPLPETVETMQGELQLTFRVWS